MSTVSFPAGTGTHEGAGNSRVARYDVTLRVGCSLAYEVTGTASVLLNLQPAPDPDRRHAVVFEALTLGNDLPATAFRDTHDNRVWRVKLAPGGNCIRYDAIIATTARPDNE